MLTDEDDLFQGARLHLQWAPAAATCLICSDEFSTEAPRPICPQCVPTTVRIDPNAPMVRLTDVGINEGESAAT